jgi:hypothetical protein
MSAALGVRVFTAPGTWSRLKGHLAVRHVGRRVQPEKSFYILRIADKGLGRVFGKQRPGEIYVQATADRLAQPL